MSFKTLLKRKTGKYKEGLINSSINKSYNEAIDENIVYLESRDGNDFAGNIFRIAEELSTGRYGDYRIYVYAKKGTVSKIERLQENYNLNIHKIITKESTATNILQKAKYIISDSGIRPKFIKRPEQILLNTWHGTPLKMMGVANVPEQHRIGSIQHTFLDADYLLYPNDFMCEVMLKGYMVDKQYGGKVLLEGYPRNSVFFDDERKDEFKSKLGFSDKDIFVYMPTYRGTISNKKNTDQKDRISKYLNEMDGKLKDNQLLLVKLHVFNQSKIDFTKFKHIQAFPEGYEVYDILNMADVLISDYSSVFFDFAVSRRKIIIFNYDEEEYLSDRNIYFPISQLPFPKVQTVEDLILELNSPKDYDDSEFYQRFCKYERPDAARYICEHIFNGTDLCKEITVNNDKPNILIYVGSLSDRELFSTLTRNLSKIDLNRVNVFLSFRQWDENIIENHESIFESIPDEVYFLPFRGMVNPTLSEKGNYDKIMKNELKGDYPAKLDDLFKRELKRYYHNLKFEVAINFDGKDLTEILLFKNFTTKNVLFLRNNEINKNILKELYSGYDLVICNTDNNDDNIRVNSLIRDLM